MNSPALQRLVNAVSMERTKREITLPNGEAFEFWMSPLTVGQRVQAEKAQGKSLQDDPLGVSLQLLVTKAKDENGQQMFSKGDLPDLRNSLPQSVVDDLLVQVLQKSEADEDEDSSPKPSSSSSRKTGS